MKFLTLPLSLILISPLKAQTTHKMEYNSDKLKEERIGFNTLGAIYPVNTNTSIKTETISGASCYWFMPENEFTNTVVIYLHGGGYKLGSLDSHKAMVTHFAYQLQTKILFIDYSLAPEHPFPNAKNEVLVVYREILKRYPKAKIFFIGDSAGGGLTISSIFYAGKDDLKLPDGVILISPWVNLKCNTDSYALRQSSDPILTKKALQDYASNYAPEGVAIADPDELNFKSFPPLFVLVGSNEILYDDSKDFYKKIKPLQSNTTFKEYKDQTHVWLLTDISSDSSVRALKDINDFIRKIKGR